MCIGFGPLAYIKENLHFIYGKNSSVVRLEKIGHPDAAREKYWGNVLIKQKTGKYWHHFLSSHIVSLISEHAPKYLHNKMRFLGGDGWLGDRRLRAQVSVFGV